MEQALLQHLPEPWRGWILGLPEPVRGEIEEIRFRVGRPVTIYRCQSWAVLGPKGLSETLSSSVPLLGGADLRLLVEVLSEHSLYAHEEELRHGYLSVPGGHRVGVVAEAVWDQGEVRRVRHVVGLNMRWARDIQGPGEALLDRLQAMGIVGHSLLIAAPPQAGKTTLLRDLVRTLANRGHKTVVLDERKEISGAISGVPAFDLGLHADALLGWPKADALAMALRTLAPDIVVMDELGSRAEAEQCLRAKTSGVEVIASLHARERGDLRRHPVLGELLAHRVFDAVVFLNREAGPGTVAEVVEPDALERTG